MNAVMIGVGVVAIFAAIVGGGVKLQNIEVGNIASVWRQLLLGLFGLILLLVGAIDWSDSEASATNAPAALLDGADPNSVADDQVADPDNAVATNDQAASDSGETTNGSNGEDTATEPAATTN